MTYMSGIRAAGFVLLGVGAAPVIAQDLTVSPEAEAMFELAGGLYPDLFLDGSELREEEGYVYRFYANSGVYVGIREEQVAVLGGPFGPSIVERGSVAEVLAALEAIAADVEITPTAEMLELFALAEDFEPALFSGGSALATSADGYLYRYYADSGIFAAIQGGSVFVSGGPYGNVLTNIGALDTVLDQLRDATGEPGPGLPEGDFTLTVTGTVSGTTTAMGETITIPPTAIDLTIEDVQAPSTEGELEEAFRGSIGDVEGLVITAYEYQELNNTADHVEFTVEVSGTLTTPDATSNFTYDLHYDYVR